MEIIETGLHISEKIWQAGADYHTIFQNKPIKLFVDEVYYVFIFFT